MQAEDILLLTSRGTKLQAESDRWLRKYGAQRKTISKAEIHRLSARTPQAHAAVPEESGLVSADPLRPCQQACLEACAKGARVIQMACGTGKTRVIRELAQTIVGKVLITVPSRLLLEQFAAEFPSFCKVGTGYNKHINGSASGFIAVTDSVSLLQDFRFKAVFMDEAHHPLPSGLPECEELFLFSATHYLEADFDYTMGEAIEEGVLCDYDLTVPIITEGHPYLSLARLLQSSPGRFRRVLAYCNSIAEAKRVHQVFKTSGMASWHINAGTSRRKREAVIREFSGGMQQPVHVLVTVQVLGEGVNIPNADTCLFVQPRNSYTSIIQALGRVLRQHVCKPIAHVILPAVAMLSSEPCDDGGSTDTAANSSSDLIADANFPSATISPFRGSSHSTSEIDVQPKGDLTTRRCDDSPSRPDSVQLKPGVINRKQSEESLESRDGVNDDVTQSSPRAATSLENVWLGNRVRQCVPVTDGEDKTRARRHDALPASDAAKDTVLTKRCALQRKLFRLSGTLRTQTGETYGSQLERFLSVIAHADRSLAISSSSLRFRLMFTDCRASQTTNAEVFSRRLMHKLSRLLEARDSWESRFVEMERFVETYGRLPVMTDKSHLSLFYWVKNAGSMLKQGRMQVHRYQKFLNSLPSIRQRAIAWKDPTVRFKSFCERLRKYVLKYQELLLLVDLDRSDGGALGLDVETGRQSQNWDGKTVLIKRVKPDGAVARWCHERPGRVVEPGDRIVSANGLRGDALQILAECQKLDKLKLEIQRSPATAPKAPTPTVAPLRPPAEVVEEIGLKFREAATAAEAVALLRKELGAGSIVRCWDIRWGAQALLRIAQRSTARTRKAWAKDPVVSELVGRLRADISRAEDLADVEAALMALEGLKRLGTTPGAAEVALMAKKLRAVDYAKVSTKAFCRLLWLAAQLRATAPGLSEAAGFLTMMPNACDVLMLSGEAPNVETSSSGLAFRDAKEQEKLELLSTRCCLQPVDGISCCRETSVAIAEDRTQLHATSAVPAAYATQSRDEAFLARVRGLAEEVLTWPHLEEQKKLVWFAALKLGAVPLQELPPWMLEKHNLSRREMGVDLLSIDGSKAVLCRCGEANGNVSHLDIKRFLRTARWVCKADELVLVTRWGTKLSSESKKWLRLYNAKHEVISKNEIQRQSATGSRTPHSQADAAASRSSAAPMLRAYQQAQAHNFNSGKDCLKAVANGARVIQMACGTGKTLMIRVLAQNVSGKVLVIVPSRLLLEQFSPEFPTFCKVGTGYNQNINKSALGFIAVSDSVHLLRDITFAAIFVDEAHHPLPPGMPDGNDLFLLSATHRNTAQFAYDMGQAIEEGVLCDYDLTVPVTVGGHAYASLAILLLTHPGRFRRVLAYCNSVAEAKRVQHTFEEVGMAAWHINGGTSRKKREEVMQAFSGEMQKAVHVLVTVQVLGEGVNIPNADTCMFVEPRDSYTSIVQAVGRILRQHESKPLAHIILPAMALPAKPSADARSLHVGRSPHEASDAANTKSGHPGSQRGGARLATADWNGGSVATLEQSIAVGIDDTSIVGSPEMRNPGAAISRATRHAGKTLHRSVTRSSPVEMQARPADAFPEQDGCRTDDLKLKAIDSKFARDGGTRCRGESSSAEVVSAPSNLKHGKELGELERTLGQAKEPQTTQAMPAFPAWGSDAREFVENRHKDIIDNMPKSNGSSDVLDTLSRASPPRRHGGVKEVVVPVVPSRQHAVGRNRVKISSMSCLRAGADESFTSQLERFLSVLCHADTRLSSSSSSMLRSRFCFAYCSSVEKVNAATANGWFRQLAPVLQKQDRFEARVLEIEDFVELHGRLPSQKAVQENEKILGIWLKNTGRSIRHSGGMASEQRLQRFLSSTSSLIRRRASQWQEPYFSVCCAKLRDYMGKFRALPSTSPAADSEVRKLAFFLFNQRALFHRDPHKNKIRKAALSATHPLVAEFLKTRPRGRQQLYADQCMQLQQFVVSTGKLPRTKGTSSERTCYWWMVRQRQRLRKLPREVRAQLVSLHPLITCFLQAKRHTRNRPTAASTST
ncbi:irc3 [Symbiodinium sp. KB8]|nr:irc3 [Symbiodinium sp. KB8]